jgi:hypothetical protein
MAWYDIFGGGIAKSVENIASEWIETDIEEAKAGMIDAESKALMIKTLDPNGKMRRDLSKFACMAYAFYLVAMVVLSFMVAFKVGDADGAIAAAGMMQDLFLPITTAWGGIVGASFGVNATNSMKGRP